MKNKEQLPT